MRRQKDGDGWSPIARAWLHWRQAHGVWFHRPFTVVVDGRTYTYDLATHEVSCGGRVVEDQHGPCDRSAGPGSPS